MEQANQNAMITVETLVNAPLSKVWEFWNEPVHIMKWAAASDDWQTSFSINDPRTGGKFESRMEAKDGSFGFEFDGVYSLVIPEKHISYTMPDGRKVSIDFSEENGMTRVVEKFDPEQTHPHEFQQAGWQAILDRFKAHTEKPAHVLLQYEINIHADPGKVYNTMIGKETYKEWTAAFNASSDVSGSWDKNAKILFIGVDQHGEKGGMVSRIKENMPGKFICIEHLGLVQGDQEITSGPEVESWAGATENYWFHKNNEGGTRLEIKLESNTEFMSYFNETWPKALEILKQISER